MRRHSFFFFLFLLSLFLVACSSEEKGRVQIEKSPEQAIQTFQKITKPLCEQDGKPIIRLFATSWCPHCQWIKKTYTDVVQDYVKNGQIIAHLWEVDTDDDLLTKEKDPVSPAELAVFKEYNPRESIPTFVFGCQYFRVGNGYEQAEDLQAEEYEFRAVIDELLAQKNNGVNNA